MPAGRMPLDSVEFYTDKKVVVERWAEEHSRKF
jgi:hypothetical protein